MVAMLNPCWIGFGDVSFVPRPAFERTDGVRVVYVNGYRELPRQMSAEIVARAFCVRRINDADRALEPGRRQRRPRGLIPEVDEEARNPGIVKQPFVASIERRTH